MGINNSLPIGIFDSGVGGLTVLNALKNRLPNEDFIYLGDTARVPYGTKSAESVIRYAEQAAALLASRQIKLLIIACNTASAVAIKPLSELYPGLNVIGVIEPGAIASLDATKSGHIAVIATEGTVNNQAYEKAILARSPNAKVSAQACSLFVALAEEGWCEGELVEQIIERYISRFDHGSLNIDTMVLGCTHFPVLKSAINNVIGNEITLVDSAEVTAIEVEKRLLENNLSHEQKLGKVKFLVTDDPQRFVRVANHFYKDRIKLSDVELVDIQHYQVP